jgi:NADPH2:quinone reductase
MRAVRCETYGAPEDLVLREIPDPQAGDGEVVVDISAAAVNFPDLLIIADKYQVTTPTPFTVGTEFAGTVSQVGAGVDQFVVGDRVIGTAFGGAFAEKILVTPDRLRRPHPAMDMVHAAASGVTIRTAYHALTTFGAIEPGQNVVVLGAAGGVGSACVNVAARLGARVIAAVSTTERLDLCREFGASEGILYGEEDLSSRIKELTGGGADIVIDPVGGPYAEPAIRALTWGGRYVCVGFAEGSIPKIPVNLIMLKGVILRGFQIRTLADHLPEAVADGAREIDDLIASGLRPHVSATFGLDDVAKALEMVADRRATGKVVIDLQRA